MSESVRLPTAGIAINMRQEGSGPPLLFLGGSNFDLSLRAPVFESALTGHFTVVAADPRGLGETDQPDGAWTIQDYARDALDLLDALGWEQACVLGESFGAMTALHLAAMAPNRIKALGLSAGAPGGAGGSSYPVHEFLRIADPHVRARRALEVMDSRFSAELASDPDAASEKIAARSAVEAAFLANHNNARGYPRLLAARAGHDAWALLPFIAAPTLVFAGRYDMQAPVARAESIVAALPDAGLYLVEGGHSICFATPEPVATLIENWT